MGRVSQRALAVEENADPNGNAILHEGYMMKRKSSPPGVRRSLLRALSGQKWVARYFVLYADGRLVYYFNKPINVNGRLKNADSGDFVPDGTVCDNVSECQIDRVKPSEFRGSGGDNNGELVVANSFYLIVDPPDGPATLLVTKGPEQHKSWIMSFWRMKANVTVGECDPKLMSSKSSRSVKRAGGGGGGGGAGSHHQWRDRGSRGRVDPRRRGRR